ncbi:Starch-binding associating with outer membrane [Porphyromonadaceae bacterium KH3R12]|nr:Starch-binding associating with outer membrane [Porphyromonadaceae bacterium KH3R12]
MKTYIRYILLLVLCLIAISCSDLLDENPKSVAIENYYNTNEELKSAVNSIYLPYYSSAGGLTSYATTLEVHTDYCYGRGSNGQMNDFQGLNDANRAKTANYWRSLYLSIRNANIVIKNAPGATSASQDLIVTYVAEAKFLRALSYFQLVRSFGGVCLRTENNMSENDCPRSTPEEIYELIISDLLEAEINLPDNQSDIGRPTLWAAKLLLADVYLELQDFQKAYDKADEVIKSNNYRLVGVNSIEDFQDKVWGPTLVETSEEIFFLKHTRSPGKGNYMLWHINHIDTGAFNFGGAYGVYSTTSNPFYIAWDDDDLRKQLWIPVNFGMGDNTLVIAKFCDRESVSMIGAGNDYPMYSYADALLIYAEASCHIKNGPDSDAMDALNQVRRRAYGYDSNSQSPVDLTAADYDQNTFIDLVLRERAYEFQFVGKRWFDLKRTGTVQKTILETKGIEVAEKHLLWPIPTSEYDYNNAISPKTDQNPGY